MSSDYTYSLPEELVASMPSEPRDASRLMVYNTGTNEVTLDVFANIADYLPSKSLLVLNDTKVVPSRMTLNKVTGGKVNILFLFNEWDGGDRIKGLPDRGVNIGDSLMLIEKPIIKVLSHVNEEYEFEIVCGKQSFVDLIEKYGQTPLPPYIHSSLKESDLRVKYQTTFATHPASVAAPTASLHFTERVFASLSDRDIERAYVTLHVGRGTFSPVTAEMASSGKLHAEPLIVSVDNLHKISVAKQNGRVIVAAGTTVLRALESLPKLGSTVTDTNQAETGYTGETRLFIRPPYEFRVANALITNFHLPGTSLLMLIDALLQSKGAKKSWRDLYSIAIAEKFRFYSFGDAMLIL